MKHPKLSSVPTTQTINGCCKPNGLKVHHQNNDKKVVCPFFSEHLGSRCYKCFGFGQRKRWHKNSKKAIFAKLGRRNRDAFCEKFFYASHNKKGRCWCRSTLTTPTNTKLSSQRQLQNCWEMQQTQKSPCGKCTACMQRVRTNCK